MNSNFTQNSAITEGGAIEYNSYQPELVNNYFKNNIAVFGNDLVSYTTRIKQLINGTHLKDITELNNIPSGVLIDDHIKVSLSINVCSTYI